MLCTPWENFAFGHHTCFAACPRSLHPDALPLVGGAGDFLPLGCGLRRRLQDGDLLCVYWELYPQKKVSRQISSLALSCRVTMNAVYFLLVLFSSAALAGAPRYENYPPRELEPPTDPRKWQVAEVQDWVESCGFYEYREAFLEAKVDGRKLLSMSAEALKSTLLLASSEHASVLEMEIKELRARRNLLSSSELKQHRAHYPLAESWDVSGVVRFLQDSGLGRHATAFAASRIDGKRLLQLLPDQIAALMAKAGPSEHEQSEADAELLESLIGHLRWRSSGADATGMSKQEL